MNLSREVWRIFVHIRWPLHLSSVLGILFSFVILELRFSLDMLLWILAWFFLWSGATLFDSYYDRDQKPVVGLAKPPRVSKSLLWGSIFFQILGFIFALMLPLVFIWIYLLGVLVLWVYSHKSFRFESKKYLALIVNFGTGFVTFATFSLFWFPGIYLFLVGGSATGFFQLSFYLMSQVHEAKFDMARKDKSFVVMFGRNKTLLFSIFSLVLAGVMIVLSFVLVGLFLLAFFSAFYFFILFLVLVRWHSLKSNSGRDFRIMESVFVYFTLLADLILLGTYFWLIL